MQSTPQKKAPTYTFWPIPTVSLRNHNNLGANLSILKHKNLSAINRNKKLGRNIHFFSNSIFLFADFTPSLVLIQLMYSQSVMLASMMLILLGGYQLDVADVPTVESCSFSSLRRQSLTLICCWAPQSSIYQVCYTNTHMLKKTPHQYSK